MSATTNEDLRSKCRSVVRGPAARAAGVSEHFFFGGLMRKGKLWLRGILLGAAILFGVGLRAQAQQIESWENTTNGWTRSAFGSANQQANFQIAGNSSTTGVTSGTTSLVVGATATNAGNGPDYS